MQIPTIISRSPDGLMTNEALFDALMVMLYGEIKRRADAVMLPACDWAEIPPAHVVDAGKRGQANE